MHLFVKSEAECVDELPHDIDGFKTVQNEMFTTGMGGEKSGSVAL